MMIQRLGFCTAISAGNFKQLRTVDAFDDYFSLQGRKYEVIQVNNDRTCEVNDVSKKKQHMLLNILKVVSYMTVITPLIMLIGKAIARRRFEFVQNLQANGNPPPIDEEQRNALDPRVHMWEARKKFAQKKSAIVRAQSVFRMNQAKKALQDRKDAAVRIQSYVRMRQAKKTLQKRKDAVISIQSYTRMNQVKKALQDRKNAAVHIQSYLRMLKVRGAGKVKALQSVREFVASERSYLAEMQKEIAKLRAPEFESNLKSKEYKKQFGEFCNRLQVHAERCERVVSSLESIAPYLPELKTVSADVKRNVPVYNENKDLLIKRKLSEVERDILGLSKFLLGEEFKGYIEDKIDIACSGLHLDEMVDWKKTKWGSPLATIGSQRLARYEMMLKNTLQFIKKIGLFPSAAKLQIAYDLAIASVTSCNRIEGEIRDLKALMEKFNELSNQKISLLDRVKFWFGLNEDQKEAFYQGAKQFIEEKKVLEQKPRMNGSQVGGVALKHSLWSELVMITVRREVEKLSSHLKLNSLSNEQSDEMVSLQERLKKAIHWLNDKDKKKVVRELIEQVEIVKSLPQLKLLMSNGHKWEDEDRENLDQIKQGIRNIKSLTESLV